MTDLLAEVDRLTAFGRLAKPTPIRDRWGRYKRDPGGQWDWYYELEPTEREYISRRHMGGTVGPDDIATLLDTDIDSAMERWLQAVRHERSKITDPLDDDYEVSWYDDEVADLVGPDEVAEMLGVKRNTVAQWRKRQLLPEPTIVLSSLPIWKRQDIEKWAKTAKHKRQIVERSEV